MPGKKYTEITSKLIESYRNDLYEENVYLIKETIYKDGFIRELKNEQSPYKEDPIVKYYSERTYYSPEELEVHLNRCFPDCDIYVNRINGEWRFFNIKVIRRGISREFKVYHQYINDRKSWALIRQQTRNLIEGSLL